MNLSQLAIQKALNCEWRKAVQLNEEILVNNPQNIDALNRLAQAYMQLGKFSKSKKIVQNILILDKFNPIAKRNLEKINNFSKNCQDFTNTTMTKPFNFIEEPGKTRVVSLVRIGERSVLSFLQSCLELDMQIRQKTISFYYQKKYIGRLPDDIAHRIIWLHKRNNKYQSFIKSIEKNRVRVFIREVRCSPKNKNNVSFV
jgi:tetratricopeptide (TPR) repeat protein